MKDNQTAEVSPGIYSQFKDVSVQSHSNFQL